MLCEKPLANSVGEAEEMTAAAADAEAKGIASFCGFSYRRTPGLALARKFVQEGRLGRSGMCEPSTSKIGFLMPTRP